MDLNIISVSELNKNIGQILRQSLETFWITGEISNLAKPRSGHWYFTIKDEGAQIRCVMFSTANKSVKFNPSEGAKVNLLAKVTLYEPRGDLQLLATAMVDDGVGRLQYEYKMLLERLSKEGLFAKEHKQSLPTIPKCIGIVSSPTGAALHDILNVLERRSTLSPIKLYPSSVQGEKAHLELIAAIEKCNEDNLCDVIILARGGGSIEDLWAFNNEDLARCIFASKIPIVCGVGHETDFTIADYVADLRAPTPSAAAEIVSVDNKELLDRMEHVRLRLIQNMLNKLQALYAKLMLLKAKLPDPKNQLDILLAKTQNYKSILVQKIQSIIDRKTIHYTKVAAKLDMLSPLATLARGYSIVIDENSDKSVTNQKQVKAGDKLRILLHKGEIKATVNTTTKESKK